MNRKRGKAYRKLAADQKARIPKIERRVSPPLPRVKGRTASQIASMPIQEFNRMDEADMRRAVSTMASVANKRLRRFQAAGESSPAVRSVEESGGRFSVKGKTLNELRSEFMRAKQFLESPTGTRSGWEKVKRGVIDALARRGVEISNKTFDDFWEAYEKLKEISQEAGNRALKYDVMKTVGEMVEQGRDPDDIAVSLQGEIQGIYEQRRLVDERGSVSSFFEL